MRTALCDTLLCPGMQALRADGKAWLAPENVPILGESSQIQGTDKVP
jgi:hypothetical protein